MHRSRPESPMSSLPATFVSLIYLFTFLVAISLKSKLPGRFTTFYYVDVMLTHMTFEPGNKS